MMRLRSDRAVSAIAVLAGLNLFGDTKMRIRSIFIGSLAVAAMIPSMALAIEGSHLHE